jgi:hypothetical protein
MAGGCRRRAAAARRHRQGAGGWKVLSAVVILAGCGGGPTDPAAELSSSTRSANFVYRWSPGDEPPDTVYQERHLAWVSAELGVEPTHPLEYHKYRDADHLRSLTGHTAGTGFAEEGSYRFHTVWPKDNHEYVHVLILTEVGGPPALFGEGIAVAHHGASISGDFDGDPLWNGSPVRPQVRAMRDAGTLPALDAFIENLDFQSLDIDTGYPAAGSFVRHLLDMHGAVPLLSFVSRCPRDADASTVRSLFLEAYGRALDDAWAAWLTWL